MYLHFWDNSSDIGLTSNPAQMLMKYAQYQVTYPVNNPGK